MPYINDKTPGPIHSQPLVPNRMEPLRKPDGSMFDRKSLESHDNRPLSALPSRQAPPAEGKPQDESIFHGKSELNKKYAFREIRDVAKEIGQKGYMERKKYGIKGNKSWDYKHFAEDVVKSLPNTVSPGSLSEAELKKGIRLKKIELLHDQRALDSKEAKEDRGRLKFLKYIFSLGKDKK